MRAEEKCSSEIAFLLLDMGKKEDRMSRAAARKERMRKEHANPNDDREFERQVEVRMMSTIKMMKK